MPTRRTFVSQLAGGAAGLAMTSSVARARVLGANDRIRVALIGAGGRGSEDLTNALRSPNTELVAVADVFTGREAGLRRLLAHRQLPTSFQFYQDYRKLLEDRSIDAVIIATPQHLHALHFVDAIHAGKDVYQEKTMAFNPAFAKRMRLALHGSNRVVQVGIQWTSGDAVGQAREWIQGNKLGQMTAIAAWMYRDSPYGGWRRKPSADCTAANVRWDLFQGEAERHPFDPERYLNWRFYWDYSGGNCFENMVHQVGFWYKVLDLDVPESAAMVGGNYFSPDMEVPDTMNVTLKQGEKLVFNWNSGFGNQHRGIKEEALGRDGTILRDGDKVSLVPNHGRKLAAGQAMNTSASQPDIVGNSDLSLRHMRNFLDCVRSRQQTNCPFELGYRSAIACQMAVAAYRRQTTVRWDREQEQIL